MRNVTLTTLLVMVTLLFGVNESWAAQKTYDFETYAKGLTANVTLVSTTVKPSRTVTVASTTCYVFDDIEGAFAFDGRFAAQIGNDNNGWIIQRNNGLYSACGGGRKFAVLNLKAGDKVTFVHAAGDNSITFATTNVSADGTTPVTTATYCVSGTAYTMLEDGDLGLTVPRYQTFKTITIDTGMTPSIMVASDGANRKVTISNGDPDGGSRLYYVATSAETAPAIGDAAYTMTTEASVELTITENCTVYAYCTDSEGNHPTAIISQPVEVGMVQLAAPTIVFHAVEQVGKYLSNATFKVTPADNSGLSSSPIQEKFEYTFTPEGGAESARTEIEDIETFVYAPADKGVLKVYVSAEGFEEAPAELAVAKYYIADYRSDDYSLITEDQLAAIGGTWSKDANVPEGWQATTSYLETAANATVGRLRIGAGNTIHWIEGWGLTRLENNYGYQVRYSNAGSITSIYFHQDATGQDKSLTDAIHFFNTTGTGKITDMTPFIYVGAGNTIYQVASYRPGTEAETKAEAPTIALTAVDGANRIYTITNTNAAEGGRLYYVVSTAEEAPEAGSEAYQMSTEATVQVTITENSTIYAYCTDSEGHNASAIVAQAVEAGLLQLAAPGIAFKSIEQAGKFLSNAVFTVVPADNSAIPGNPTVEKYEYTFTADGGAEGERTQIDDIATFEFVPAELGVLKVYASATGYEESFVEMPVSKYYVVDHKSRDFSAFTADDIPDLGGTYTQNDPNPWFADSYRLTFSGNSGYTIDRLNIRNTATIDLVLGWGYGRSGKNYDLFRVRNSQKGYLLSFYYHTDATGADKTAVDTKTVLCTTGNGADGDVTSNVSVPADNTLYQLAFFRPATEADTKAERPVIEVTAVGVDRKVVITNPNEEAGSIYYAVTDSETAPAVGDEAYTRTDEASVELTVKTSSYVYAYCTDKAGATSAVVGQYVEAGTIEITESYDFYDFATGDGFITLSSQGFTNGDETVYLANDITLGDVEMNLSKRFAFDLVSKNFTDGWRFRNTGTTFQKGLVVQYNKGNGAPWRMSVVDLLAGSKVTISYAGKVADAQLLFANTNAMTDGVAVTAGSALISGTEYTIAEDGQLDLYVTNNNIGIHQIVIKYTDKERVSAPKIALTERVGRARKVTITAGVSNIGSDVTTYYTTDGSEPTTESASFTDASADVIVGEGVKVETDITVKAYSISVTGAQSVVASETVTAGIVEIIETYDFAAIAQEAGNINATLTGEAIIQETTEASVYLAAYGNYTLGNRFATSKSRNNGGLYQDFWIRSGANQNCLTTYTGNTNTYYLSLLNLLQGDQVTITYTGSLTVQSSNAGVPVGTEIVSETTYTMTADGHLDFSAPGQGCRISKVEIKSIASEKTLPVITMTKVDGVNREYEIKFLPEIGQVLHYTCPDIIGEQTATESPLKLTVTRDGRIDAWAVCDDVATDHVFVDVVTGAVVLNQAQISMKGIETVQADYAQHPTFLVKEPNNVSVLNAPATERLTYTFTPDGQQEGERIEIADGFEFTPETLGVLRVYAYATGYAESVSEMTVSDYYAVAYESRNFGEITADQLLDLGATYNKQETSLFADTETYRLADFGGNNYTLDHLNIQNKGTLDLVLGWGFTRSNNAYGYRARYAKKGNLFSLFYHTDATGQDKSAIDQQTLLNVSGEGLITDFTATISVPRMNTLFQLKEFAPAHTPVAQVPTIAMTKIIGESREYTITFQPGETLHYVLPEAEEQTATESPVVVTVSQAGELKAWTTLGISSSDVATVEVVIGMVALNDPKCELIDIKDGWMKRYRISIDNSHISPVPEAKLTYVFTPAGGEAEEPVEVADGEVIYIMAKGTVTVNAEAVGFDGSTTTVANDQGYKLREHAVDFAAMTAADFDAALWTTGKQNDRGWDFMQVTRYTLNDVANAATVFPGVTLFTNKYPTIYEGYGLMAPNLDVDGMTSTDAGDVTLKNPVDGDMAVYSYLSQSTGKDAPLTAVQPVADTYHLGKYFTILRGIDVYQPISDAEADTYDYTGITAAKGGIPADGYYYNLQGVRVEHPSKGLYIHHGKTVVIR